MLFSYLNSENINGRAHFGNLARRLMFETDVTETGYRSVD
jgi:hypothetical protein